MHSRIWSPIPQRRIPDRDTKQTIYKIVPRKNLVEGSAEQPILEEHMIAAKK